MAPPNTLLRAAAAALALGTAALAARAESSLPVPVTTEDALRAMSDAAGVIFSGTVIGVRGVDAAAGFVEIDFAVNDAIRGLTGTRYTLREWKGLWTANDQPLRIGQRYLMLLHAPNAAGVSSPVGGTDGAIPIRGAGPAAAPDDAGSPAGARAMLARSISPAAPAPAVEEVVDLGWVATRVAVPLVYARVPGESAIPITVHASTRAACSGEACASRAAARPQANSADPRSLPYSSVLQSLRTWEAAHAEQR